MNILKFKKVCGCSKKAHIVEILPVYKDDDLVDTQLIFECPLGHRSSEYANDLLSKPWYA